LQKKFPFPTLSGAPRFPFSSPAEFHELVDSYEISISQIAMDLFILRRFSSFLYHRALVLLYLSLFLYRIISKPTPGLRQPVFALLNAECLAEKQQIPIL
jgi:NADH:ubiquinone oxidoreductase subunit H